MIFTGNTVAHARDDDTTASLSVVVVVDPPDNCGIRVQSPCSLNSQPSLCVRERERERERKQLTR